MNDKSPDRIDVTSDLAIAFFNSAKKNGRQVKLDELGNAFFEYVRDYGTMKAAIRLVLLKGKSVKLGSPLDASLMADTVTGFASEPLASRDPLDKEIYGNLHKYRIFGHVTVDGESTYIFTDADRNPIIQMTQYIFK